MEEQEKTPAMTVFRRVLAVLLVLFLLLATLCVAAPSARKKKDINAVGTVVEEQLSLVPSMIAYYNANELSIISRNPGDVTAYAILSDALAALRVAGGYDSAMLIVQSNKQGKTEYVCGADGLRNSGYNSYGAGSLMSLPKSVNSKLDAIYADPSKGGTVPDIVEGRTGGNAACTLLPVPGAAGGTAAVLSVQSSVGDTDYKMLGGLNLYVMFAIFAVISLVIIALLILTGKTPKEPPAGPGGEADPWAAEGGAPASGEGKKPWSWPFGKKDEPADAVVETPDAPADAPAEPAPAPDAPEAFSGEDGSGEAGED